MLLVISGPSGVGKGTVFQKLNKIRDDLAFSVSATTRAPRPGEKDGVDYFFIDEKKFQQMLDEDDFLEHAKVHTNHYGTPAKAVEEQEKKGKLVLLEIDVQGALQVKKKRPDAILLFMLPPKFANIEERLRKRATETDDVIRMRVENAKRELDFLEDYDYAVVNRDVDECASMINCIVQAEKLKVKNENIERIRRELYD